MRFSLLLIILLSSLTQAQIYRHVEPDGTVVFSDKPQDNAEEYKIKPIQIVPATKVNSSGPKATAIKHKINYTTLNISSPLQDQTITAGAAGNLNVSGILEPTLGKGHQLLLLVDGKTAGTSQAGSSFNLQNMNRGSHNIQLQVVDEKNNVLKSSKSIQVHIQRPIAK